jgi:hypothetical protein
MNYYSIVIKQGIHKNRIIADGFAATRKEIIERNKQTLIDCGVYLEAAGFVFKRNFIVKLITRGA